MTLPHHLCVFGGSRWLVYSLGVLLSVTSVALGASVKNTNHTLSLWVWDALPFLSAGGDGEPRWKQVLRRCCLKALWFGTVLCPFTIHPSPYCCCIAVFFSLWWTAETQIDTGLISRGSLSRLPRELANWQSLNQPNGRISEQLQSKRSARLS